MGHGVIVAAFDEGPGMGLGHRRRIECIGRELGALGIVIEPTVIGDGCVDGDVVLIDSYRVRGDDPERVRASTVIAIDDIERDLAVDLVVDPRPGAQARPAPRSAMSVAGATYALVDPHLRSFAAVPARETVRRVMVATGATDSEGVGAAVASEIADALAGVQIRLVVGEWGRSTDDERLQLVHTPAGLAVELAAADLVVTAAGVTMLEACCLGRPTVAFSIADNQSPALAGAAAAGAVLATDRFTAGAVAIRLAHDYDARTRLSTSARALVDGRGAARVASLIENVVRQETRSA